jgi:hypothetical protein
VSAASPVSGVAEDPAQPRIRNPVFGVRQGVRRKPRVLHDRGGIDAKPKEEARQRCKIPDALARIFIG